MTDLHTQHQEDCYQHSMSFNMDLLDSIHTILLTVCAHVYVCMHVCVCVHDVCMHTCMFMCVCVCRCEGLCSKCVCALQYRMSTDVTETECMLGDGPTCRHQNECGEQGDLVLGEVHRAHVLGKLKDGADQIVTTCQQHSYTQHSRGADTGVRISGLLRAWAEVTEAW